MEVGNGNSSPPLKSNQNAKKLWVCPQRLYRCLPEVRRQIQLMGSENGVEVRMVCIQLQDNELWGWFTRAVPGALIGTAGACSQIGTAGAHLLIMLSL